MNGQAINGQKMVGSCRKGMSAGIMNNFRYPARLNTVFQDFTLVACAMKIYDFDCHSVDMGTVLK